MMSSQQQHLQQVNYYQGDGDEDDGNGGGGGGGGGGNEGNHHDSHGKKSSLGTQLELFLHHSGNAKGGQNNSRTGSGNYPRSPSGGAASLASASRHSIMSNASAGNISQMSLGQMSAVSTQSSMISGTSQSIAQSIMSGAPQPPPPQLLSNHELADLARKAQKSCQRKFATSLNSDTAYSKLAVLAQFDFDYELQLGAVLGQGQFGVVSEVRQIHLDHQLQCEDAGLQRERELVTSRTIRREGARGEGDCRYAVKVLRQAQCCDRLQFYNAYRDMAIEIHLLAALEHRHILKLRAISSAQNTKSSNEQAYGCAPSSLFLMTDKLYGTLKEKYADWRLLQKKLSKRLGATNVVASSLKKIVGGPKAAAELKERKRHLLEARLRCLRDVASAIQYLHSNHIIQRDLKPDNVGFDVRGDVKLFDFGLSTEVPPIEEAVYTSDRNDLSLYKLTGMTGSLRYMAPENYNHQPYNESIDIYALSIIIWQTMTLQHLYPNHDKAMIIELVVQRGNRPELTSASLGGEKGGSGGMGLTETMQKLLKNMWSVNVGNRPPAKYVLSKLQKELALVKEAKQLIQVQEHEGGDDGHEQHRSSSQQQQQYDQQRRPAESSTAAARQRIRERAPKGQVAEGASADGNCDMELLKKHQAQRKIRHSGRKDLLTEIEQALDMEQKMTISSGNASGSRPQYNRRQVSALTAEDDDDFDNYDNDSDGYD